MHCGDLILSALMLGSLMEFCNQGISPVNMFLIMSLISGLRKLTITGGQDRSNVIAKDQAFWFILKSLID